MTASADGEKVSAKTCESLTKTQYDDIDDFIDDVEDMCEMIGCDGVGVDVGCGSDCVIIPLLSLIMLLL